MLNFFRRPAPPSILEPPAPPPSAAARFEKEKRWIATISKKNASADGRVGRGREGSANSGGGAGGGLGPDGVGAGDSIRSSSASLRNKKSFFRGSAHAKDRSEPAHTAHSLPSASTLASSPPLSAGTSYLPAPSQSPAPAPSPPPSPATPDPTKSLAIRLQELAVAHADGLLDEDEYRMLRQQLFESHVKAAKGEEQGIAKLGEGSVAVPRLSASTALTAPASSSATHFSPPLQPRTASVASPPPSLRAPSVLSSQSKRTSVLPPLGSLFRRTPNGSSSIRNGTIDETRNPVTLSSFPSRALSPSSHPPMSSPSAQADTLSILSGRSSHTLSPELSGSRSLPLVQARLIRNHPGLASSALDARSSGSYRMAGSSRSSTGRGGGGAGESVFSSRSTGHGGGGPRSPPSLTMSASRSRAGAAATSGYGYSSSRGSQIETLSSLAAPSSLPPIPSSTDPLLFAATDREPTSAELEREIKEIEEEWGRMRESWRGVLEERVQGWEAEVGGEIARRVSEYGREEAEERRKQEEGAGGAGGVGGKKGLFRRASFTPSSSSSSPPSARASSSYPATALSLPSFLLDPALPLPTTLSAALPPHALDSTSSLRTSLAEVLERQRRTEEKYEKRSHPASTYLTFAVSLKMAPAPRGSASGATFQCPDCTKTFSRKEYMARHHRSKHSKEKPFICEYCDHAFSRSDLLRRHYKTCQEAKALGATGPGQAGSRARSQQAASTSPEPTLPNPHAAANPIPLASTSSAGFPPPPLPQQSPASSAADFLPTAIPVLPPAPPSAGENAFSRTAADSIYPPATTTTTAARLPPTFDGSPLSLTTLSDSRNTARPAAAPGSPFLPDLSLPASFLPSNPHLHQNPQHQDPYQREQDHPAPSLPFPRPPHHEQQPSPFAPPPSAFRPGTANNDTLAPGLSGTGSFSADEVLASEVLRDLMRSPMQPFHPNLLPGNANPTSSGESSANVLCAPPAVASAEQEPWHGARAAERPEAKETRNEAVALVGTHDWGLMGGFEGFGGQDDMKIEETPAAMALAEYFNKGGVGGISALDLGFPTEPSLFPDWLINPKVTYRDEVDQRFYVPEQMFCLGYLYPWHVPPVKTLSSYAKRAAESLLPSVPVVHAPSIVITKMATHTAFALTVAGGAYEPEGQAFSNEMLVEKRVFLVRGFQQPEKTFDDRFASLQSLLLYQLLGLFHRDEQQRLLSQTFHSALIFMLRSLDLPNRIRQSQLSEPGVELAGEELEQAWKDWVQIETYRRVAFIVFLTDLEHSIATDTSQLLLLSDMQLDLPSSDAVWSASTSPEWAHQMRSPREPPPIPFLTAIRALLAPRPPDPFSQQGIVLAELSRLSSFPLLILSRTLSFLERKTEEALQQVDPFHPLLGGLGIMEDRERENRDILSRIRTGREILRRLPGGMARGGGERWFQDVMPTAAGGTGPSPVFTASRASSSSGSGRSSDTSPASTDSTSTPYTPPDNFTTLLEELDAADETDARAGAGIYQSFHGEGGAVRGESYAEAQERMRKHRERRARDARTLFPEMMGA
ncbi:hypothetical protein JCM21900_005703 [Sporobolomyces salmonicolor]